MSSSLLSSDVARAVMLLEALPSDERALVIQMMELFHRSSGTASTQTLARLGLERRTSERFPARGALDLLHALPLQSTIQ